MPEIRVEQGRIRGTRAEDGVFRFRGIPYAAPPVGERRWRASAPAESWDGVRDASRFAAMAVQTFDSGDRSIPSSEDCLYLNVWTQTLEGGSKQPVMVWIHGGGFLNGSASAPVYDGASLARRGVTVVSINYRLGAFGFLTHPEIGANFAVLDWVQALRWVKENIAAFGGDPDNVTVFGQSAGGAAGRALLSTPSARGLFNRVIIQSAGFEHYAAVGSPSYERSVTASTQLFERLGTTNLDELRQLPTTTVRETSLHFSGIFPPEGEVHVPANLVWYPVSDGDVLDSQDFAAWTKDVPVMLGCVEDEARFFIRPSMLYAHPETDPALMYTEATLEKMACTLGGKASDRILAHYAESGLSPYEALADLFSTAIWFEPAMATLDRFGELDRTVFYYHFAKVSVAGRESGEGVFHSAENPYIFGNLHPSSDYDESDAAVSDVMQNAWVTFARSGTPRNFNGTAWAQFDSDTRRHTRIENTAEDAALDASPVTQLISSVRSSR